MEDRNPKYPAVKMFAVWGNPTKGASGTLLKFPAGYHTGWHWHATVYQAVVIQGKFTHIFKQGGAPRTGGPGTVFSQPARQVEDDKCEEVDGDCIIDVLFIHGKLDYHAVDVKAQ